MGIDFKVNFNTKIKINGEEYGSIEEVPEQFRDTIKNAMDSARNPLGHNKLTVNGVGYDKPEDMPPDVRRTYEEALRKAQDAARRTGDKTPPSSAQPGAIPGAPVQEGALSSRTLIIIAAVIAAAFLLKFLIPK